MCYTTAELDPIDSLSSWQAQPGYRQLKWLSVQVHSCFPSLLTYFFFFFLPPFPFFFFAFFSFLAENFSRNFSNRAMSSVETARCLAIAWMNSPACRLWPRATFWSLQSVTTSFTTAFTLPAVMPCDRCASVCKSND